MNKLAINFAIGLGHAIAKKAADKAERESPTWQDQALTYLREYAQDHSEFQSLHVRLYAENRGHPVASEPRAWGHILLKAKKLGIITATNRSEPTDHRISHGRRQAVWLSNIATKQP